MKFLVKVRIPAETGNKAIRDGSLFRKLKEHFAVIKPEAVYFTLTRGQRTLILVVDLPGAEKLPEFNEPFWINWNAEVTFHVIADMKDFEKAEKYFASLMTK